MKKMTFLAALLGFTQFSNAQVGIGTATPADAVQLEISATNKGILIPRIELRNTTTFGPITGTAIESLLVYNTATAADVTPGFYYWVSVNGTVAAHWERIVNQTQLDEAIGDITDLQGDVSKIIELLKVAFPSNNLVAPSVNGDTHGGGMVFIPGATPTIEYVYFDGTNYVTKDITSDIINLIKGNETKTFFRKVDDATTENAQYLYFSEEAIQIWLAANSANTVANIPNSAAAVTIDAVSDVVNNFESILNQTTEYNGVNVTVEQIIKELASQVEGNVIYKNIAAVGSPANWVFQYWDGTQYQTISLTDLVGAAQSKTALVKTNTANAPVKQYFVSETYLIANAGAIPSQTVVNGWTPSTLPAGIFEIDIVAGVATNIQTILDQTVTITEDGKTFTTVEQYIQYISSKGDANVGYTVAGITAANNNGVAIPANSFYYINQTTGNKVFIDLSSIVKQNETKTKLIKIGTKQYYVSESYTGTTDPTTGAETGVYEIDVIDGIVNNFNEFITSTVTGGGTNYTTVEEYIEYISANSMQDGVTKIVIDGAGQASFQQWNNTTNTWVPVANTAFSTIVKANETVTTMTLNADGTYTYKNEAGADVIVNIPASVIQELGDIIEATTTFNNSSATTLVEYIQNMINNTDLPAGTVTAEIVNGNIVFSIIDVNGVATVVPSTAFNNIVKANETKTTIGKSTNNSAYAQVLVDPKAAQKVVYEYLTESATVKNYIDVTADVEWSIENNTNVKNAIEDIINNLLNQGGNVYFTRTAIAAGTPAGQLAIPAFSFYTINATTGVKELVDIAQTIVNAITNATTIQKQEIKNQLGDTYNTTTVTNTGDTWIDGSKIYAGVYAATVTGGTANVSTISITPPVGTTALGKIVSIKLLNNDNNIINTSTTDVALAGSNLSFRIGTGNMYNVLSSSDLSVKVVVEFSAQ